MAPNTSTVPGSLPIPPDAPYTPSGAWVTRVPAAPQYTPDTPWFPLTPPYGPNSP